MEIEGYFIDFRARVLNPQILPSSEEKCDKKNIWIVALKNIFKYENEHFI